MRLVSWLGGFLVIAAIVATAGAVSLQRQHTAPHSLVASRLPLQTDSCCTDDATVSAPHRPYHAPPSPVPAPVAAGAAPAAPPPRAALVIGSTQQALINQDRARNGLAPLSWSGCLYSIARAQAAHLATPGVAFQHYGGAQQDLGCGLGYQAGENIAWYSGGANDSWANSAFMASPEHYANIMGPYHYVATAWVTAASGYGYIAVEFG